MVPKYIRTNFTLNSMCPTKHDDSWTTIIKNAGAFQIVVCLLCSKFTKLSKQYLCHLITKNVLKITKTILEMSHKYSYTFHSEFEFRLKKKMFGVLPYCALNKCVYRKVDIFSNSIFILKLGFQVWHNSNHNLHL